MKKVDVSIIIVHYKVEKELFACIDSIKRSSPKCNYEIIVVDNDEEKIIEDKLKKSYPEVVYLANNNNGWGGGTNAGVEKARGEYLYFLNPDTVLLSNVLDASLSFITSQQKVGVVSAVLVDKNIKEYPLQGSGMLTPFTAVVVYSAINRIFPQNPISRNFYYHWPKNTDVFEAAIPTLTAAMIKKTVFMEVGRFDEAQFLYFEEFDLGRRLVLKGYKNYILPRCKVLHYWESSTKQRSDKNSIFFKSRRHYLTKHFGKLQARLVEAILHRDLRMLVIE